jgi:hypothetical protein
MKIGRTAIPQALAVSLPPSYWSLRKRAMPR